MKPKLSSNIYLFLCISLLAACGGGGGNNNQWVEITGASRCAIGVEVGKSDNCMGEKIEGGSYVTDQNAIHLFGSSSVTEDDGCPEPTIFGPTCVPTFPYNYGVRWINSSNDASGIGEVAFLGVPGFLGFPNEPVRWTIYDPTSVGLGYVDPKGVPLEMGSNTIRVTTTNSGLNGNAEITITRVVDVTPPTVHHVTPEPGGTYNSRVSVYFSEQLDPSSVVSAIIVFDENAQPLPGTIEFDPLKLVVIWRPQSPLIRGSSYTARISDVTDWAPNVMIDLYEWSFTTQP